MKLTTEQLRTQKWGTPCGPGYIGDADTHLSHPLIIDFFDTFFGGELDDVETDKNYDVKDHYWLLGGNPTLKKTIITTEEFNKFVTQEMINDGVLEEISEWIEVKKKKLKDIDNEIGTNKHPEIIRWIFSFLIGMRCDWMGDGRFEIESE